MCPDISSLGLKSSFDFKETRIPTSREMSDIRDKLREFVAPTVRDLESRNLINGFYHIVHNHIDLRLSCDDWQQHEESIKEVLSEHSISTDLTACGEMSPEVYGGETGVILCYNNLEFNSRLTLALFELMHLTDETSVKETQEKLCPHQWVHHLCNQSGYLNFPQIVFEFIDGFMWLHEMVARNRENDEVITVARNIARDIKNALTEFESWLG
jgi:hypothetical protein